MTCWRLCIIYGLSITTYNVQQSYEWVWKSILASPAAKNRNEKLLSYLSLIWLYEDRFPIKFSNCTYTELLQWHNGTMAHVALPHLRTHAFYPYVRHLWTANINLYTSAPLNNIDDTRPTVTITRSRTCSLFTRPFRMVVDECARNWSILILSSVLMGIWGMDMEYTRVSN